MVFARDLTQWRVYAAEQSIPPGNSFGSIEEARTYLWWVRSTRWWAETFPHAPHIDLEEAGAFDLRERTIYSFARKFGPQHHLISLERRMLTPIVLLHEIAHCLTSLTHGDPAAIRRDRLSYGTYHAHGHMFTAALTALVSRYATSLDSDLAKAYEHFGVQVASLPELQAAREHSIIVEQEVEALRARIDERQLSPGEEARLAAARAERDRLIADGKTSAEPMIPVIGWGYWIYQMRRHRYPEKMVSQRTLAAAISSILPCSAKDIARLERLDKAPTAARDQRLALAIAAFFRLDPLQMENELELVPSVEVLTLDQLRPIATEWVSLIEDLNSRLETRPPRWNLDHDR